MFWNDTNPNMVLSANQPQSAAAKLGVAIQIAAGVAMGLNRGQCRHRHRLGWSLLAPASQRQLASAQIARKTCR